MRDNTTMSGATMSPRQALRILAEQRSDRQIVITNQGSARIWPQLSSHPLDLCYNPSTMGGAIPLGIGIAVARSDHQVIVVSGDGSLLMSMGSLVTAAASRCHNLVILILDNGRYEVTGGQRTAAHAAHVNFTLAAQAAGINDSRELADADSWQIAARDWLPQHGLRFASLRVLPSDPGELDYQNEPIDRQLDRIRRAMARTTNAQPCPAETKSVR